MSAKKEEKFVIQRFNNSSGKTSYRVSGYKNDGSRVRKNFKSKTDAIEYKGKLEIETAGDLNSYALQRTRLTSEQLADAETALSHSSNHPLSQQVSHYQALQQRVAAVSDIGIESAIAFYEQHYRPDMLELPVHTAIARFLDSRKGVVSQTKDYYAKCTKVLSRQDPNKLLHKFTTQDVETALAKYCTKGAYRTYRRGINVFFNWAVRAKHCLENPCDHMERAPKQNRQVAILRLEEIKRLLKATTVLQNGAAAASIAILLFAGLRPSELEDLKKQDVRKDYIVVSGGKLRGRSKRRVAIPAVLREWLNQYPFEKLPSGWYYKLAQLKKATVAKKWVSDILRHTSISFQLERDKNEAEVAFNNGTSVGMINLHYRDLIEAPEANTEFWKLTPKKVEKVKLKASIPGHKEVQWPTDAKLKKLVWAKPLSRLAVDLDVSDSAIRKRCKQHGIELPKNGHWQREFQRAKSGPHV
ncbi:hypothetical protein N9R65_04340 [Opitutales bacterium]|nr:hypothetical protein [Opitutales bacterium]